jgi:DnaK suppressor protein
MDDLSEIRQQLEQERAGLSRESQHDAARPEPLDQSRVGRLSRMDAMQMTEMAAASERRNQQRLQRIEAALTRIEAGQYGLCLSCEEDIAPRRLASDPAATLCIACATARE